MKERMNFTLETSTIAKLRQISNNSVSIIGRDCSMSQVIEIAISRLFVTREAQIRDRMLKLYKEANELEVELNNLKEKRINQEAKLLKCTE